MASNLLATKSAWSTKNNLLGKVEKIFVNNEVQNLLKSIIGLDIKGKIFKKKNVRFSERSHYALMNDEMFETMWKKTELRGQKFLQLVPFKEPRKNIYEILSNDEEIKDFDTAKFIFTDITFDATNQTRTVIVREPNGLLRTALPEEHDRMCRVYYHQEDRPVLEPPVFKDPYLTDALNKDYYEFVLDWACYYFEPDNLRFVELCQKIFDKVVSENKYDLLYSTRHFGSLIFYLVLNDNTAGLENYFNQLESSNLSLNSKNLLENLNKLKLIVNKLAT